MDRKLLIQNLVKQRYTYQAIGNLLGISRQRIHQIFRNYRGLYKFKNFKDCYEKKCQICGKKEGTFSGFLNVHHLDKNHKNNNPTNLITLCPQCHSEIHQ